ncbi:MAG: hypothetical protein ACRDMA_00720 [Solirubrobacterales bacterium]
MADHPPATPTGLAPAATLAGAFAASAPPAPIVYWETLASLRFVT